MPVFVHRGYGIDWDTGPFDQAMAVRFEKAAKAREVEGEVKREFWGRVVDAGAEAGVIPPLRSVYPVGFDALPESVSMETLSADQMIPGVVAWLAGKIARYHKEATGILPE